MCGFLFSNIVCKKSDFLNALSRISHRGPDGPLNFFETDGHKFGHNRLTILDKSDEALQPFFSEDKRHLVIYNGEIYNYLELAREYDITLKTHCDTELLLKLYLKLGEKFLEKLNGMFAFIIYDTVDKTLFFARDRLGIKPIYYYERNSNFIISSEPSPILHLTSENKLDDIGIRQYKKLRSFFNGRTIYSNIKTLPAGYYVKNGKTVRYWELDIHPKEVPSDDTVKELFESAVKYRTISDVPIGSYLSGGLDSTIIAKIVCDYTVNQRHTWTVGSKDNNEFKWAKIAADYIKSDHHEILIENEEFFDLLKRIIKIRKEPLSVPNEVLIYKMTKEAKKYNTVLLSGEGADELFFGYDRIFSWAHNNKWDIKEFTKLYAYGSEDDFEIVEDAIAPFVKKYDRTIDIVAAFFQISHLHGLLRRLDSSSMLAEVEARVPFVDHRLVELMAGVPFESRTSLDNPKKLLKKLYQKILPSDIINRKKVGFPVDLEAVLPKDTPGENGYDKWFNLNLKLLQDVI